MLRTISWQQYLLFLFIVIVIYYLCVWIICYKAKLPSFSFLEDHNSSSHDEDDIPDELQGNAWKVIRELKPVFHSRQNKHELIYALQAKLKDYQQWDEPGFRETINVYILGQSEKKCSIRLSEEDLRVLWI